jgi:7,8-dihydropterin-6-yl-methyl-4-(beta-D-ribofuranosyl)aminobenzene 5'-phosphate synthase
MDWKITIICENTVTMPGLLGEHGFAAYLETPGHTILFDTGQGFTLVQNALRLGKNLRRVTQVVLSHGHFDHTGAIRLPESPNRYIEYPVLCCFC